MGACRLIVCGARSYENVDNDIGDGGHEVDVSFAPSADKFGEVDDLSTMEQQTQGVAVVAT